MNINDIGYFLYMEEQERKKEEENELSNYEDAEYTEEEELEEDY